MSGDSASLALPLASFATADCEAATLYRELRKPLLRYLVCLGLSSDDAQDVVQDAFLGLYRHLGSGGSQQNLRAWLFRVAHNLATNRRKSYERRFGTQLDFKTDSALDEITPEDVMLEKEKFRRLENAVQLLAEPERECLLLRAGGLRYREIGEVLGIPTSTVADAVDRAIKRLAEKYNV